MTILLLLIYQFMMRCSSTRLLSSSFGDCFKNESLKDLENYLCTKDESVIFKQSVWNLLCRRKTRLLESVINLFQIPSEKVE